MRKLKRDLGTLPTVSQLNMPDLPGLPRNWDIFLEHLRQRRYTSGDVESCIGVSRKVLRDWDHAGILAQLYQGLGAGHGNERFGRWRLFCIFDIWNLAFYKRLRDEGIYIERLRGLKHQTTHREVFEGDTIQWWFYQALPSWVYRQPYWVHSDLQTDVGFTPIERHNLAIYLIRIAHIEPSQADLFMVLNLIPLMDHVMVLSGPLQLSLDKAKGVVVQIEGEEFPLEPLPKPSRK